MSKKFLSGVLSLVFSGFFLGTAIAQDTTTLTVLTLIDKSTEQIIELTEEDLLAFEQVVIRTENEFVDGMGEFSGPLARDVLALFDNFLAEVDDEDLIEGNEAQEITATDLSRVFIMTAVNDYAVQIPADDLLKYDVIFAMFQDGNRLSLRTKGPIWVIYPMSENNEVQDRIYNDRLIWQLASVTIE